MAEVQHDAVAAVIADQQIRSPAQNPGRDLVLMAAGNNGGQFVSISRLDEILGPTADLQPGISGQRFIAAGDFAEVLE